jgi:hypothetical protein
MVPAILITVGLLVATTVTVLVFARVLADQHIDRVWEFLEAETSGGVFEEDMVADLPPAAQNYFLNAIEPSTPLAATATLQLSGTIRLRPDGAWMPFTARQILCGSRGFVWRASIGAGLMRVSGADFYAARAGCSRFWLWRILPLARGRGPDVTRSAAGRLAIESILLPSTLLPQKGVQWEASGSSIADATLDINGETVTLTLKIDPEGVLRQVSMLRWRPPVGGCQAGYFPFGVDVHEEGEVGGYTVPTRIAASWDVGTDHPFEFFRCTVEHIEFH